MRHVLSILIAVMVVIPAHSNASDWQLNRIGPVLEHPWGMDFINKDTLLITERGGNLLRMDLKTGTAKTISGQPRVQARGQGGLLDVMVINENIVWLCYAKRGPDGSATALGKGYLSGERLERFQDIFVAQPWISSRKHYGCRLGQKADGAIVMTAGERGQRDNSQNPQVHPGSVVRVNPDGTTPTDNPYTDGRAWLPELYSIGNRNPQGLAIHPKTGAVWIHEHGPQGGDEINIVRGGENFGWPIVTHGEEYGGGKIGIGSQAPGYNDPIHYWTPSIAPSGMAFYTGSMFPEFTGDLLIGSLKFEMLVHVILDGDRIVGEQHILKEKIGRIRDVAMASDGSILILTDEYNGGLWRLSR